MEHFSVRPPLVRTSLLRQMSFKQHWLIYCRNCNEISIISKWSEFHEMNSLTSTGMRCFATISIVHSFSSLLSSDSSSKQRRRIEWIATNLCSSSYICSCGMYSTRSRQSSYKSSRTTWNQGTLWRWLKLEKSNSTGERPETDILEKNCLHWHARQNKICVWLLLGHKYVVSVVGPCREPAHQASNHFLSCPNSTKTTSPTLNTTNITSVISLLVTIISITNYANDCCSNVFANFFITILLKLSFYWYPESSHLLVRNATADCWIYNPSQWLVSEACHDC